MIDQYPSANGVLTSLIWRKTAAGGETSLSGYDNASQTLSYTPGQEQVYLNGILLVRGDDYTATNGTSITGLSALAANDFVQINCYNNFSVASVPSTSITGTITNSQLAGSISNDKLSNSSITINGSSVSLGGSVSLAGDIESVTAGTGLTGGGTSGAVTLNLDTSSAYVVPSQTSHSGKYLTTNGTSSSWAAVDALPSQTGNSGKYLTTNGTSASWGSINAAPTWTQRATSNVDNGGGYYFIKYYNNTYIAGGNTAKLTTSSDEGLTWTARTSGFTADEIYSAAYGNGIWVIVGTAGKIATSTNLSTWTLRTSNMGTNTIYSVEYLNGYFIAVGDGASGGTGGIVTSTDGITWTKRTTPASSGSGCYYVTYANGYYVVATSSGTSKNLLFSTDLATWTASAISSNTGGSTYWIYYDSTNSRWYAACGTTIATSSTTTPAASWTWNSAGAAFFGGMQDGKNMYISSERYMWTYSPATNGSCLIGASLEMVGNYVKDRKIINNVPSVPGVSGDGQACRYESNSRILWADGTGRIYTSF